METMLRRRSVPSDSLRGVLRKLSREANRFVS